MQTRADFFHAKQRKDLVFVSLVRPLLIARHDLCSILHSILVKRSSSWRVTDPPVLNGVSLTTRLGNNLFWQLLIYQLCGQFWRDSRLCRLRRALLPSTSRQQHKQGDSYGNSHCIPSPPFRKEGDYQNASTKAQIELGL